MAHNEFELLHVLISMLDDARNDIYLHVDKKAKDFVPSDFSTKHAHLFILNKRLDVRWGHFSQIKLEMLLFETAAMKGPYAYYHLLSGVDLPIKSQDYIHDFFAKHQGKEFVGFWHDKDAQAYDFICKYHFFMNYERNVNRYLQIIMSKIRKALTSLLFSLFGYRKINYHVKKGFNWVSITHPCVQYIISKKKHIFHRYRFCFTPDEIYKHSILWNSEFVSHIYEVESVPELSSMRCIDWKRGEPYAWGIEDSDLLSHSPYLFARKFSTKKNREIIKFVYEFVMQQELNKL